MPLCRCRFVKNYIQMPASISSFVDLTAGLRVYNAQCMTDLNLSVQTDLTNPGDLDYQPAGPFTPTNN